MSTIGQLRRVPLRHVWKHEAQDLSVWLQTNLDVVNEATGLALSTAHRERAAGSFNVDLVAQNASGATVVIESQLDHSDHDHLGRVLTYLVAVDAQAAVWIVSDPRPEHVAAVGWLNKSSSADVYLLKLEVVQIGDSPPAPLLTRIVGPSEGVQVAPQAHANANAHSNTNAEAEEPEQVRLRFWRSLLSSANEKTALHQGVSPSGDPWLSTTAGRSGLLYLYGITPQEARVELYIGTDSKDDNEHIFDCLYGRSAEIEAAFGSSLEWERDEQNGSYRIAQRVSDRGYLNHDEWESTQRAMVDGMVRLERAVAPYLEAMFRGSNDSRAA